MTRVLLGLASVLALAQLWRFAGPEHALDDAWITFRIARNLVEHGVPTFAIERPAVEGMSNPTWTIVSAVIVALGPGRDPIEAMRGLGAAAWLGTIAVLVVGVARHATLRAENRRRAAVATILVLAASGSAAFHAISGLETGLWALLGALAIVALADLERGVPGAAGRLGLSAAGLVLTRPEGLLLGGLLVAAAVVISRRAQRTALVPYGVAVVALFGARRWIYGAWLPNTFAAKPPDLGAGVYELGLYLTFGLGVVGLGVLARPGALRSSKALAGIAAIMIAGTVWSGGDWMPGHRRFTFASLVVAWLAGAALARSPRGLGAVALAGCLVGSGAAAWRGIDHGAYSPSAMPTLAQSVGASPGVQRVALVDIGRFGWGWPGEIVDLVGLTDREIAAQPGPHLGKWSIEVFESRDPDLAFVFVHTKDPGARPLIDAPVHARTVVEDRLRLHLLSHPGWRLHGFVRYASRTWIAVFARDRVTLPAAVWGTAWDLSPA